MWLTSPCARGEIHVKSFSQAILDREAQLHPVMDKDGKMCALVRVKFSEPGLSADATQIPKSDGKPKEQTLYRVEEPNEVHPDEVWIYLKAKTRRFRLSHPKYGNMAPGDGIKDWFYQLSRPLDSGVDYIMEIECDENFATQFPLVLTEMPVMSEVSFVADKGVKLYLDGERVVTDRTYHVVEGNHRFSAGRLFHSTIHQRYATSATQPLQIQASPVRLPFYLLGGVEVGKPSAYADLAYGARIGYVARWGVYASFMTTMGNTADGPDADAGSLPHASLQPYDDPHYCLTSWHVGMIYRCFSPLHVYAGLGTATADVTWMGLDGKRHANPTDHVSAFSWEAGLLYNVHSLYVSAGTDYLQGRFGARVGIGAYLKLTK